MFQSRSVIENNIAWSKDAKITSGSIHLSGQVFNGNRQEFTSNFQTFIILNHFHVSESQWDFTLQNIFRYFFVWGRNNYSLSARNVRSACQVQIEDVSVAFAFAQIPLERYECISFPHSQKLIVGENRLFSNQCKRRPTLKTIPVGTSTIKSTRYIPTF